jgi:hypothetical protein
MRISLKSFVKFVRSVQVLIIIGLLFVAYSLILPEDARIEREIEIQTGPELIFSHFDNLELFNRWSPWYQQDTQAKYTFSGPTHGVGATVQWRSENGSDGNGSQEIITSVPYKIVSSILNIDDHGSGVSSVTIYNNRENTRCRVLWSYDVTLDGVVQRYMGQFLDRFLGPDFEKGLINLKALAETGTTDPARRYD